MSDNNTFVLLCILFYLQCLPSGLQFSCKVGQTDDHLKRNRFKNIIACEKNILLCCIFFSCVTICLIFNIVLLNVFVVFIQMMRTG